MSLTTIPEPPKQYPIAIFAAKSLDDPRVISRLFPSDRLAAVSHIYTNGANHYVQEFAAEHGIPVTIFPLTGGRNLPQSTSDILAHVDFAYIIADNSSKSAAQILAACERKWGKPEGEKKPRWRVVHFDPVTYWKERVQRAAAAITAMTPEDWEKNPLVRTIAEEL